MEQKEVWNKIAIPWKKCRKNIGNDVFNFLNKHEEGNLLDLGCGSGRNFIKRKGKIYAVDFSEKMIELAKKTANEKEIEIISSVMNEEKIDYPDEYFDVAVFIAVLHCVETKEKRERLLKELYRVLKKDSEAMITVWARKNQRLKNKPKEGFLPWTVNDKKYLRYTYIFEKEELEFLLKKVGFKILSSINNENISIVVKK